MKKLLFCFFWIGLAFTIKAQNINKLIPVDSVKLSFIPQKISQNWQGNFCASDQNGNIYLLDSAGQILQQFSANQQSEITILESSTGLTFWAFYEELQRYILFNRFLVPIQEVEFEETDLGYISWAASSADRQIWVMDNSSFSFKKFNPFTQQSIEIFALNFSTNETANDDDFEIQFLQEYQNLLFISEENQGILVFDNLGNHQKTLPFRNIQHFQFYKNQIYFLQHSPEKNTVIFYDFYTNNQRIFTLNYPKKLRSIFYFDSYFVGFQEDKILVFDN